MRKLQDFRLDTATGEVSTRGNSAGKMTARVVLVRGGKYSVRYLSYFRDEEKAAEEQ
jgi:hypothetical protein